MQIKIATMMRSGHWFAGFLFEGSQGLRRKGNSQLQLQVLKKFRLIFGSVRSQFRDIEESCGVSGSQLWLLHEIGNTPDIGISELAERLSIHQSTCSQLVDKLASKGLVTKVRSPEDQRRVGLTLSANAVEKLKNAPGPAEGILPAALRELPADTLLALDDALMEVIEQLTSRDEKSADRPLADL